MELKTLNELGCSGVAGYNGKSYTDIELRENAIKWIKELESYRKIQKPEMTALMLECVDERFVVDRGKADWIKHFFNITEIDLQNGNKIISAETEDKIKGGRNLAEEDLK